MLSTSFAVELYNQPPLMSLEKTTLSLLPGDRRSGICLILCWHLIHVINLVSLQDFFLGALQTLEPEDSSWFLSPAGARNGLNFVN